MTTVRRWLLFALTTAAVCAQAQPSTKRIAVLEFRGNDLRPQVRAAMADEARAGVLEATRGRGIAVMTRESMAAMLKDMGKSGCGEGECEVETARNIGADYVVSGEVVLIDGEVHLSMKLHESAAGNLLATKSVVGAKQSDAIKELAGAARALVTEGLATPGAKRPQLVPMPGDLKVGGDSSDFVVTGDAVLVQFDSEPSGAAVTIDGEMLCKETPCSKSVEAGVREVTIQKERYETARSTLQAKKGAKLKVTLVPKFAVLTIVTNPVGLHVLVDGLSQSAGALEIDAGSHEVLIDDPCFTREGMKVSVKQGEQKRITLEGHAKQSAIKVTAETGTGNEVEAKVLVDGVEVGTTPGTFKVATCSKQVEVRDALGGSDTKALTLQEKQVTTVRGMLGLEHRVDDKSGLVWIRLPAGSFGYGCVEGDTHCYNNEARPAEVRKMPSFWMLETEVTVKAFEACANAGGCNAGLNVFDVEATKTCNWKNARATHPINCLDASEAAAFCKWVSGRLPTGVEWEYAAKSGRPVIYPWGNDSANGRRANYCDKNCPAALDATALKSWRDNGWIDEQVDDGYAGTAPVGTYPATTWGLKDMAGNAWEWTATDYDETKKEVRGGGWGYSPIGMRTSFRNSRTATLRDNDLGFRCVQ